MALTIVNQPTEISYSRSPIVLTVQMGADPEYTDVYALLTVYSSLTDVLTVLYGRPDADYKVSFDVSAILDTLVDFEQPDPVQGLQHTSSVVKAYWLQLQQFDGDALVDGVDVGKTEDRIITNYVIKGGLSQEKQDMDIFQKISSEKMFLSWENIPKLHSTQPFFLYYLHQQGTEALQVKCTVKYTDYTRSTLTLFTTSATKFSLLYINAGFDFNNLGSINADKTVLDWCIWIEKQTDNTVRADKFYFQLSDAYTRTPVFILYANSLGGFNSLYASGEASREIDAESQEIERYTSAGSLLSANAFYKTHSSKVATGHLSKNEMLALTDILLSDSVFEVVNEKLEKIVISNRSKIGFIEIGSLRGGTLEYTRAKKNKNFTPDHVSS